MFGAVRVFAAPVLRSTGLPGAEFDGEGGTLIARLGSILSDRFQDRRFRNPESEAAIKAMPAQGSVQGGGQVWLNLAVAVQPLLSVTVSETICAACRGPVTKTALVASLPLTL